MVTEFVPLFLMVVLAAGLALTLLKLAEWLGPALPRDVKSRPYESGMDPVGSARDRYSVKFYLVAMIFIVFDVELVFLYPWAVSFKTFLAARRRRGRSPRWASSGRSCSSSSSA